jgi:hypothetical protein
MRRCLSNRHGGGTTIRHPVISTAPLRVARRDFHPFVTPMIPFVTRSWLDPDAAGTMRRERRKR